MTNPTTMAELATFCKAWDGHDAEFAVAIGSYLGLSGTTQRVLADEFEAAISTVSRWATGRAKPRPRMQKLIIAWIGKCATRAADAARVAEESQAHAASASWPPGITMAAKSK
jgi:hypothetical protein